MDSNTVFCAEHHELIIFFSNCSETIDLGPLKATCPHSYINDNNQLTICVIIIITVKIVETLQTSILVSTAHLKITIWRAVLVIFGETTQYVLV